MHKQRLPREKKERKRKRKQEETNIDFSTELKLQDRSAILSASGSIANKERKKKEKNMIDKVGDSLKEVDRELADISIEYGRGSKNVNEFREDREAPYISRQYEGSK